MIEDGQVLDLLSALVEKSLVVYEEDAQGNGRYRLLETLRQYGRDRAGPLGARKRKPARGGGGNGGRPRRGKRRGPRNRLAIDGRASLDLVF